MIAEELIADIRVRTDIVALIGDYVSLKQRGASFVGLCPFHNEKTPSFHVRRDRQFFHCFGCHESGDALAFLMRLDGLTFPQAARTLAERAGLDLPETDDREDSELRRERERHQRLCALMEVATAFYEAQLQDHRDAPPARAELEARGVKPETRAKFRLGYAPNAWDALVTFLEAKGHSLQDAEQLGLLARRREGRGYYDRFRHRLMFPVADVQGRIVAFSGRLLPEPAPRPGLPPRRDDQAQPSPKYVNSPESPIYKKGELLFGLHAARVEVRRNGWAIVCEGNFDLVALHQAGFENAVAPLGTAFTAAQAKLIRRFAQRVTLMFDGDTAGRKAVHAAYPLLRAAELTGRVARLPPGDDPDTYLRKHGVPGLTRVIDDAIGIVEYVIDASAAAAGPDAEARAVAIQSLGPVLMSAGNPVEIELYIQRIARRFALTDLGVVKEQLRRGVRAARPTRPGMTSGAQSDRSETRNGVAETKVAVRQGRVKLPELALQRDLLGALLDKPELFRSDYAQRLRELLTAEDLQAIFSAAAAQIEAFGAIDASRLVTDVQGNEAAAWLLEQLSVETHPSQARAEEYLRSGIPLLQKHNVERERAELAERIQQARQHGDESLAIALTRQRDAMRIKL